jgi:hypothetical protein
MTYRVYLLKSSVFAIVALSISICVYSESEPDPLVGRWRATDSAGISSIIELYIENDKLFGRIVKTMDDDNEELNLVCEKCKGPDRGKAVNEIVFIRGLVKAGDRWVDGTVIDIRPGFWQGTEASCELSMNGEKAEILGYKWFRLLGQSSSWTREPNDALRTKKKG